MRADIVIVSHRPDLPWLNYSLRLILKHWSPKPRVVVRLDENCRDIVEQWSLDAEFYYVRPWPDGYTFQMYQKMTADDFTDAELIILWDSDLMLTGPASIERLLSEDGKPIIEWEDWNQAVTHSERIWRGPTSLMMGMDLNHEYMCGVPFTYWRETFSKCRNQIARTHRRSFFDCLYSDVPFSAATFMTHPMKLADFEALGLTAAQLEPRDRYRFRHSSNRPKDWPFKLYWSHGGLTPEVRAELDAILTSQ